MTSERTIAVVGAGLSGLRTAEGLRRLGWTERVVVVGAEVHMPYTRPPLSKKLLTGGGGHADVALKLKPDAERENEWVLGRRVVSADLAGRTLGLDDGGSLAFHGLVVATGVGSRRLPESVGRSGTVLRTVDDAAALAADLVPGAQVVVIGAGFIGCEVAAAATARGCRVTVVALDVVPMLVPLGPVVGAELQRRHAVAGVDFRLGVTVLEVSPGKVVLGDGTVLPADVVVEAIGSRPHTDWLEGNGLDLADGVRCEASLRVAGRPGVVATGDVARFPNLLVDDVPRRVEHWQIAADSALPAARTLLHDLGEGTPADPFTTVPSFWSDQGVVSIRSFGMPGLGTTCEVLEGELGSEAAVGYRRAGSLVGVVLLGLAKSSGTYLRRLTDELRSATGAC